MPPRLSWSEVFRVFGLIFVAVGCVVRLVHRQLDGQWLLGICIGLAVVFVFLAYSTTKSEVAAPPADPPPSSATRQAGNRGSNYFKKCPACGKFTRGAKVCRICDHDLKPRYKPSTTPGTSEL